MARRKWVICPRCLILLAAARGLLPVGPTTTSCPKSGVFLHVLPILSLPYTPAWARSIKVEMLHLWNAHLYHVKFVTFWQHCFRKVKHHWHIYQETLEGKCLEGPGVYGGAISLHHSSAHIKDLLATGWLAVVRGQGAYSRCISSPPWWSQCLWGGPPLVKKSRYSRKWPLVKRWHFQGHVLLALVKKAAGLWQCHHIGYVRWNMWTVHNTWRLGQLSTSYWQSHFSRFTKGTVPLDEGFLRPAHIAHWLLCIWISWNLTG